MTRKINTIHLTIFFLSISLSSCKKTDESIEISAQSTFEVKKTVKTPEPSHYDYKVVGTDENGANVHGYINIEGQIGLGNLISTDAKNIEVVAEWLNKHTLIATDLEGYKYILEIK
jgi:hypothetical protein